MHRVLKAEMVKKGMTIAQLAAKIGVSEKTLRNKINGDTDFTLPEAQAIRRILESDLTLDELFATDVTDKEKTEEQGA
jgi:toxin-antitoxin system, antitoxin component, xre family